MLGLPKNTLDVPKYREVVKNAINDAMVSAPTMCSWERCYPHVASATQADHRSKSEQREKEGSKRFSTKGRRKWTSVAVEVCQVKGVPRTVQVPLHFHHFRFQEVISDSDSAVEPAPSPSRSNVKLKAGMGADEVQHTPT